MTNQADPIELFDINTIVKKFDLIRNKNESDSYFASLINNTLIRYTQAHTLSFHDFKRLSETIYNLNGKKYEYKTIK